jgi:hypothetical protein
MSQGPEQGSACNEAEETVALVQSDDPAQDHVLHPSLDARPDVKLAQSKIKHMTAASCGCVPTANTIAGYAKESGRRPMSGKMLGGAVSIEAGRVRTGDLLRVRQT